MSPAATDPTVEDLNKQTVEKVAQLATMEAKLDALSEEATEKQRVLRMTFKDAHAKRFADIDPKRALIGAKCSHEMTIKDVVSFHLKPPARAAVFAVDQFITEPTIPDPTDTTKSINLGPVNDVERLLMGWLVAVVPLADVSADARAATAVKRQELDAMPPGQRLKIIRSLPEALLLRVADEALLLQSWLNVILEIELGNF